MKKVLGLLLGIMLSLPIASQAFSPTGDEMVGGKTATTAQVHRTPATVYIENGNSVVVKKYSAKPSLTARRVKDLIDETDGLQKETAGLKDEVGKLSTGLAKNTKAVDEAGKNISGLATAVENTAKAMTGMDGKMSQYFWLTLVLLLILLVVVLSRIRAAHSVSEELLNVVHAGFQTAKVDQLATQDEVVTTRAEVAKIPDALVKLKRLATVLEFKDVDGKGLNVTVMPLIIDGNVFTLRLPDSVDPTAAYTDSTIPRTPAKNRSHLVSTDEETIKAYYGGEFNGHDDASSLKLRIIKAAFRNGEIVENK